MSKTHRSRSRVRNNTIKYFKNINVEIDQSAKPIEKEATKLGTQTEKMINKLNEKERKLVGIATSKALQDILLLYDPKKMIEPDKFQDLFTVIRNKIVQDVYKDRYLQSIEKTNVLRVLGIFLDVIMVLTLALWTSGKWWKYVKDNFKIIIRTGKGVSSGMKHVYQFIKSNPLISFITVSSIVLPNMKSISSFFRNIYERMFQIMERENM